MIGGDQNGSPEKEDRYCTMLTSSLCYCHRKPVVTKGGPEIGINLPPMLGRERVESGSAASTSSQDSQASELRKNAVANIFHAYGLGQATFARTNLQKLPVRRDQQLVAKCPFIETQ